MTERRFFSGATVDQAVMKAARHYEIGADELAYQQVEKKHGFLRVRRSVVIEVDPQAPRKALSDDEALRKAQTLDPQIEQPKPSVERRVPPERSAAAAGGVTEPEAPEEPAEPVEAARFDDAEEPEGAEGGEEDDANERIDRPEPTSRGMVELPARPRSATERFPVAEGATAEAAAEALQMLLDLAGTTMESSIHQGDERLEIELWGPDQDRLLRDHGRPLLAMQHLLPRLVRGLSGETVYCRIDCDHFHDLREERLRDLAQRVASEVVDSGRSRMLESMAPDERRIVHMTLANDPNVVTESQGNGFFKRVRVRLA